MFKLKVHYNSPVILTYSLLCIAVYVVMSTLPVLRQFFVLHSTFSFLNPIDYFTLVSYTLGHGDMNHLISNIPFLLLLGPILEEKYGSRGILIMMVFTALFTALINLLLFRANVLGASGIVFLFIVLVSFVNVKKNSLPLTVVLVALFFLGREVYMGFQDDNISQSSHIIGGICGGLFGFLSKKD